jgi:uncharacterized protein YjbI with pentapeptide repeats
MHDEISKDTFLQRYAAGERDFRGIELPENTDLSHANLEGAIFDESWLGIVNFQGADLRNVSLMNCHLKSSDFRNADMRGAILKGSSVEAAQFYGAKLEDASFVGIWFYGIELTSERHEEFIADLLKEDRPI